MVLYFVPNWCKDGPENRTVIWHYFSRQGYRYRLLRCLQQQLNSAASLQVAASAKEMGRLEAKYVMQNRPCCEHIVEDGWGEAVARLEPSKWSKSVRSCGGTVDRTTAWQCPFSSTVVPVSGKPGLHFLQPWYRNAGPFGRPDSGPKMGTGSHQSVVFTIRGRKTAPILGPESGTRNGSVFCTLFANNLERCEKKSNAEPLSIGRGEQCTVRSHSLARLTREKGNVKIKE